MPMPALRQARTDPTGGAAKIAGRRRPAEVFGDMLKERRSAHRHGPTRAASPTRRRSPWSNGKANVVDVVTAVAETEVAVETLVAVRDRVIAAYEEIMRMPI